MLTKRCPLTSRFGHDVAWLIHKLVWQQAIDQVNADYANTFNLEATPQHKRTSFWFNFRRDNNFNLMICNLQLRLRVIKKQDNIVGTLPLHYWKIKELY